MILRHFDKLSATQSSVTKKILIFVLLILIIMSSCRELINPVDPEAENYQGYPIYDGDSIPEDAVISITGVFPATSASLFDTTPLLDWDDIDNAKGFQLQLSETEDSLTTEAELISLEESQYLIPLEKKLEYGKVYYWRVRIANGENLFSAWSEVCHFSVDWNISWTGLVPVNEGTTIDTSPQLEWDSVGGVSGYKVRYADTEAGLSSATIHDESDSYYQITEIQSLGDTVYWQVCAVNEDGVSTDWSVVQSFTVDWIVNWTGISPSNWGSTIDTTPLLDWDDVGGVIGYKVKYADTEIGLNSVTIHDVDGNDSYYQIIEIQSLGDTMYWQICAVNADDVSTDWSPVQSFTVDWIVSWTGISPEDGGSSQITPMLDWGDVTGATGYHIQLNTNSSFTGTFISNVSTLTDSQHTITTPLSSNTTYYWRVEMQNADGVWGDWSNMWSFTADIYALSLSSDGNGSTNPSGSVLVSHGESIAILASPSTGYFFNHWSTISGSEVSYGNNSSASTTVTLTDGNATMQANFQIYTIGDIGPAGGHIFYDKGTYSDGWRWLEAAPYDQTDSYSEIEWGGYGTSTDTVRSIGMGESNTITIVNLLQNNNGVSYAAKVCQDLEIEYNAVIYNDWFLPSLDELYLMRDNLLNLGLGGFRDSHYWSSTEDDEFTAELLYFSLGGNQPSYVKYRQSDEIRAARAF